MREQVVQVIEKLRPGPYSGPPPNSKTLMKESIRETNHFRRQIARRTFHP